jgi:hypothetical protein
VLLTRGPVTCSYLSNNCEIKASEWTERNIVKLVSLCDVKCIKRSGFWLVTKTHHATEVAKAVFQSRAAQASFDAGVEVRNVAKAKASTEWWTSESVSSGFEKQRVGQSFPRHAISTLMNMQAPEPDRQGVWPFQTQTDPLGVVTFFGGILWRPGQLRSRKWFAEDVKNKQKYLGSGDDTAPATLIELPGAAEGEEELAFLELRAGVDGEENSYAIYANSDSD